MDSNKYRKSLPRATLVIDFDCLFSCLFVFIGTALKILEIHFHQISLFISSQLYYYELFKKG
jgi:hypothetical protein